MSELAPLKIKCTDSRCEEQLHCFRPTTEMGPDERGRCRSCGADVVDWAVAHTCDLAHFEELVGELGKELIRHHYWHIELPEALRARTMRYRPEVIADRTRRAVRSRVAAEKDERWDGQQTPTEHSENPQVYFLGMHATACCCRACMAYWHDIDPDRALTEAELDYFTALVWLYVCQKMGWPELRGLLAP